MSIPTVLIAEDDSVIAMAIAGVLEAQGMRVSASVRTAEEGAAELRTGRPDVAVVDVALADGSDGLDLVRACAAAGTPALVVSGHLSAQDAMAAGAAGFLAKPFDYLELAAEVRRMLARDPIAGAPLTV
ncbi:response regulator transcription factor [Arenibaculum sp.]|uniref:response regulator transcription factor n=1 Tax=Arenibaculum sp. TaxID=2865862 RepID=UPI002E0E6C88|nr:response regulator [Arenibaculum sp.]